jgi:ADP-ribosyl-[dinitrogen reductase] hydrolase
MLVELAVGDAYGAGFEYADAGFVAEFNDLGGFVRNPRHPEREPNAYTDDTQMTLAVAEALVDGLSWTREMLADKFVEVFHRDRRVGYSGRFYRLLCTTSTGSELLERLDPRSDRSGAAMRVGPIGLLPDVEAVLWHAEVQARVTHDTTAGVEAAQAAALAVHYCQYELGPVAEVGRWIDQFLPSGWSGGWSGAVGPSGRHCVLAALTVLAGGGGMAGMLRRCVAFTGDVDTVAAIAMAAASRSPQIDRDLPAVLVDGLENGQFGRDYLTRLDRALLP